MKPVVGGDLGRSGKALSLCYVLIYHGSINENNRFVEFQSDSKASAEELAPVLGARKNRQANANSSRGMLLTVLGELVRADEGRSDDGRAWTQTLVEVLALLDIEEKAARQAISRLAERGWLDAKKVGRRTRWTLTPSVTGLLEEGAARIYGFGQDEQEWDGQWVLLNASVPERQRKVRYKLTSNLNWAGFGSLGHGWWISPRPQREAEAKAAMQTAGISDATSFIASTGSMGDSSELALRAWDLDSVRSSYNDFMVHANALAAANQADDDADKTASATQSLIHLVHAWRRFPFLDPDLPSELLPQDWPGRDAAARFRELHDQWKPLANHWWHTTQESYN